MNASLYIHVPFCAERKCTYCAYYSLPVTANDPCLEHFVESTLLEATELFEKYKPKEIPTLHVGGGTPSILGAAGIRRLIGGVLKLISGFSHQMPSEITVEANPESADEAFLTAAREAGVTRLSLGVQTFHEPSRRAVNRETLLPKRLALAAEYFPENFSVDLISGLPFQNKKILLDDITAVTGFSPAHVSLYALTLEPETPLKFDQMEDAEELWIYGRDALENSGYRQYEISNFCLDGKESQHNIRYWRMLNWLALGLGASGTIIDDKTGTGIRYTNPEFYHAKVERSKGLRNISKLSSILGVLASSREEQLDKLTLIKETLLMGFRYIEGPDEALFQRRFRRNINGLIPKTIETWRERGLLQKDKCALTKEGLLLLNRFLMEVFDELESAGSFYK